MPIGGFVVNCLPQDKDSVLKKLSSVPGASVYGEDDRGYLILVLETETSEAMEQLVDEIATFDEVLAVNLAYLHGEDEVEQILKGRLKPPLPGPKRRF